jgi:hypothetical protein
MSSAFMCDLRLLPSLTSYGPAVACLTPLNPYEDVVMQLSRWARGPIPASG